jgi:hypothetical protein
VALGIYIYSGWWFGTCFVFPYIWNFIIPTDSIIFQRGIGLNHQPVIEVIYPLVNIQKTMERSTMLLMGKSTISMAIFNSYFDITRGYIIQYNYIKACWLCCVCLFFSELRFNTEEYFSTQWNVQFLMFVFSDETIRLVCWSRGITSCKMKTSFSEGGN